MDVNNDGKDQKLSAQQVLKQFRRREILDATAKFIKEEGIQNLTMDRIAERAGIAKGTIYTYFKDKVDLIAKLLVDITEGLVVGLEKAMKTEGNTRERLMAMGEELNKFGVAHRKVLRDIHICNELGSEFYDTRKKNGVPIFMKIISTFEEVLADGIKAGEIRKVDPMLASIIMIESMEGLVIVEEFIDRNFEEVTANDIINIFLDGLLIQGEKDK